MKIKNKNGFAGIDAVIMIAFTLLMMVGTVITANWIMSEMGGSINKLARADHDMEALKLGVVTKTYNWSVAIMMSLLGLGIIFLAFTYFIRAVSPERNYQAKQTAVRLLISICATPFIGYILMGTAELNKLVCVSFLDMSGVDILVEWKDLYVLGFGTQGYGMLLPMFALTVVGLAISVYMLLIFRLLFMMMTYAIAPISVLLLAFPHLREWGMKLLKIYFESVFCLFFFDMGFVFSFAFFNAAGAWGLDNPFGLVFAIAGLALPLAVYKMLWNPISKAVGSAVGSGIGAMTGMAGGGMKFASAAPGVASGITGRGGGGGGGTGGTGGGTPSASERALNAGAAVSQAAPETGVGAMAGAGIATGVMGAKGAKRFHDYLAEKGSVEKKLGVPIGETMAKEGIKPSFMTRAADKLQAKVPALAAIPRTLGNRSDLNKIQKKDEVLGFNQKTKFNLDRLDMKKDEKLAKIGMKLPTQEEKAAMKSVDQSTVKDYKSLSPAMQKYRYPDEEKRREISVASSGWQKDDRCSSRTERVQKRHAKAEFDILANTSKELGEYKEKSGGKQ